MTTTLPLPASGDIAPNPSSEQANVLRAFRTDDTAALQALIEAGWSQFAPHVKDWPAFLERLLQVDKLAKQAELIVAEHGGVVSGFVGYAAPGRPKAAYFDQQWAGIRMLTVSPAARGHGLGRLLTNACLERAAADGAGVIALHTSPAMRHALDMYLRLGFIHVRALPELGNLEYHLYIKHLVA